MTTTSDTSAEPVMDLFAPEVVADPWGAHAKIREQPTLQIGGFMGGPPMFLAARYEHVRQILTDPRFLCNPLVEDPDADIRNGVFRHLNVSEDLIPWLKNLINASDGEEHARLRKLVSYALTNHRVSKFRPRVEELTSKLLDHLAEITKDGESVDLVQEFCYPLPVTVICELVGVDEQDRAQWRSWSDAMATLNGETLEGEVRATLALARDMLQRRRDNPQDDLITALIQAQAANPGIATDDELVGILFSLVTAGHQTTTYLIGNSVLALLEHPDQLQRLKDEPTLWPQAVRELQRLGPIQYGQPRFATEDVELGGVIVPKGMPIVPMIMAANADPRKFPEPEKLIVDRLSVGSESHLGFGKGIHRCLGQHVAYLEAEVALRGLFTRFPDLHLAVPREEVPWILRPGFTRTKDLPLFLGKPAS
ncbi:cytochrome P450 family protein [Kutzneria kofuensis]|uniref:Cytochrome P450 n=1 Tax=Kutzneria kofuensis TaxID=103725 RepID=A0A7W9KKZ2_9PSEU|nr:cytochrome P450 [Kutzneria kofuensis]MBB5893779.1 cytochrome P450 [Kutzneria kofuensis]